MNFKKISKLLNNFDDSEANKINSLNEKSLSKELKNIIKNKNNNNNINTSGSGSVLKRKPIDTSILISNAKAKK